MAAPVKATVKALRVEAWLIVAGVLRVNRPVHVRIASPIAREAVWGPPPGITAEKMNGNEGWLTTKESLAGKVIARLFAGTVPEIVTTVGAPAAAGGAMTAAMV